MQHILVIDNHDSFVYNLVQLLRQNGRCRFEIISNDRIAYCHPVVSIKSFCLPDRAYRKKPEICRHSSTSANTPTRYWGYALVIRLLPKISEPAYNSSRLPGTAIAVRSTSQTPVILYSDRYPPVRQSVAIIPGSSTPPGYRPALKSVLWTKKNTSCPSTMQAFRFTDCNFIPNPSLPATAGKSSITGSTNKKKL